MITRAIIEEIIPGLYNEPPKYRVRIPIFDNIDTAKEYTSFKDLNIALACLSPYLSNVYAAGKTINGIIVGDAVFVGFEDNDISRPVILGPIYNPNNKDLRATTTDINTRSITAKNLEVTDKVNLPIGTNIGEIKYQDLLDLVKLLKGVSK